MALVEINLPSEVLTAFTELRSQLTTLTGTVQGLLAPLRSFGDLLARISGTPLTALPAPGPAPGPAPEAKGGGIGDLLGAASGAIGGIAGAALGATASLAGIVAVSEAFVAVLSPSVVEVLNAAFRDLSAVIGVALIPIIEVATEAVREISDILLPVMLELQPIIRDLAAAAKNILIPIVMLIAGIFESLAPILQILTVLIEYIAAIFRVWMSLLLAISQALRQFISSIAGSDFKNTMDEFKKGLQGMVVLLAQVIASLLKFLGATEVLANFIRNLEGGRTGASEGLSAIKDVRMTTLPDIVRDMNLAAARATEGSTGETTDWMKEAAEAAKRIAENTGPSLSDVIADGIVKAASRKVKEAKEAVLPPAGFSYLDWIRETLSPGAGIAARERRLN